MITIEKLNRMKAKAAEMSGKDANAIGVVAGWSGKMNIEGDGRTVQAIVNTDDMDCDEEVVVPSGLQPGYFGKNKSVFVDHEYGYDSWVGNLRDITPFPGEGDSQRGWMARVWMRPTPLGDDILTAAREGGVGVSIGFIAEDWGPPTKDELAKYTRDGIAPKTVVRSGELTELSFTAMPCNVSCRTLSIQDGKAAGWAVIERMVTKGRIRRESAKALGLPGLDRPTKTIILL